MKKLLNLETIHGRLARLALWLIIIAVIVALDYYSKQWASRELELYRPKEILPWLNMTLAHNYGAAFSFLSDQPGWQRWFFTILGTGISVFLFVWLLQLPAREKVTGVALSMILGGAIGNLIDRVALGYVVDFIDIYARGWHWPAFNIADSSISAGIALLLIDSLILQRFRATNPETASSNLQENPDNS